MTHDSIKVWVKTGRPTTSGDPGFPAGHSQPDGNFALPYGNETSGAYKVAVESRKAPTLMAFSRQGLPNLDGIFQLMRWPKVPTFGLTAKVPRPDLIRGGGGGGGGGG